MNTMQYLKSSFGKILNWHSLKQLALVFGMMSLSLLIFSFVPEVSAQTGMIDPADNPENVSLATGGEGSVRALARTIVNFFLFFLGLIATIMVIYGGVLYVTAAGNDDQVGKAKNVILYAIAGIIVILLSFALVNTVILGAGTADETAADPTGTGGGTP